MVKREMIITDEPPKVWLVGITQPKTEGFNDYLSYRQRTWGRGEIGSSAESLAVFGGAVCYDSFHNPSGKSDFDYIGQSIIDHEHFSVLEHIVVNLAVASLPRSAQLELVRHRAGMAYSFRSTRFTDSWIEFCVPTLMRDDIRARQTFESHAHITFNHYEYLAAQLADNPFDEIASATLKRKRIKEAARDILGGCVGSDGLVSMNARSLRHVIGLRSSEDAALSIREFAWAVYEATKDHLPAIFQDATTHASMSGGPPVIEFGRG